MGSSKISDSVEDVIRELHSVCKDSNSPFETGEKIWIQKLFNNCIYGNCLVYPSDIEKLEEFTQKVHLHFASK